MIGFMSRRVIFSYRSNRRHFCTKPLKFLRNKQFNYEIRLNKIKEFVLKANKQMNGNIDWNQIVCQLGDQKLTHRVNFEVDLMSAFLVNNETDTQIDRKLFESMAKYIKSVASVGNNSIAVSRYYHFISHFDQYIEESEKEIIRLTTDQLMAKYVDKRLTIDVLKPSLIGLSKSSKDNCLHSIKLLNRIEKIDFQLFSNIIESTLKFKLIEQTFDLIEKYPDFTLSEPLVSKLINSLSEYNPNTNRTIKLLEILSQDLRVFDSNQIKTMVKALDAISYKTNNTSVAQNGLCLKCDQRLSGVTPEEQKTLIKDFRSIVFNKENDLLMKTFPEYEKQLKNFDHFIRKITSERPLDLVIDGLNLAFSTTPQLVEDHRNLRQFIQKYPIAAIDSNIVELLTKNNIEKYENVLIVGRKHMKRWNKLNQFVYSQRERISMFYAMNKTQDDLYIVYSALKNPNTYIISNDLYRDLSEKMRQKRNLFDRWLASHQISVPWNTRLFVFPDQFDHKIHISQNKRSIHIPFRSHENSKIDWICCQKSIQSNIDSKNPFL